MEVYRLPELKDDNERKRQLKAKKLWCTRMEILLIVMCSFDNFFYSICRSVCSSYFMWKQCLKNLISINWRTVWDYLTRVTDCSSTEEHNQTAGCQNFNLNWYNNQTSTLMCFISQSFINPWLTNIKNTSLLTAVLALNNK